MASQTAYFNGAFLPREDVRISPDDRGFLLADGVYEVVRAYGGVPFALGAHLARLDRSLRSIRIEGADVPRLAEVCERLIRDYEEDDALVYIQVTRGAAPRRHAFPPPDTPPTVYALALPCSFPQERWEKGVPVTLVPDERWARCDIKSIGLLPNVLANQRAKESGVEEAVFVRDGFITEGSHTNVAAVLNGAVVTYPDSHYVLPGITRGVVIDLCRELGIELLMRPFSVEELLSADEAFIMSTAEEVLAVVSVDGRTIGSGSPGTVTRRLLAAFRDRVRRECRLAS